MSRVDDPSSPTMHTHNHPLEKQLLLGNNGRWTPPTTPTAGLSHHQFEDDHGSHHEKRSVLAKVKDKAKKWKHLLQKKRHAQDAGDSSPTLAQGGVSVSVALKEDMEENEVEDPEFHGAPMYESELAPDIYRDAGSKDDSPRKMATLKHLDAIKIKPEEQIAPQLQTHPPAAAAAAAGKRIAPVVVPLPVQAKHIADDKSKPTSGGSPAGSNRTLTETVSDMLAPAYAAVSGATNTIASKIQAPVRSARDEMVAKQVWDKGVSVKEYLLQKLEPGDGDKALSQVITEAISPRKRAAGDCGGAAAGFGVVDRVKDAVFSVLGKQEPNGPPIPVSTMPHTSPAGAIANLTRMAPAAERPRPVLLPSKSQPASMARTNPQPILACSMSQPVCVSACSQRSFHSRISNTADSRSGNPTVCLSHALTQ